MLRLGAARRAFGLWPGFDWWPAIRRASRAACIAFDDLAFSPALHRVLVSAGNLGNVFLVTPESMEVEDLADPLLKTRWWAMRQVTCSFLTRIAGAFSDSQIRSH